MTAKQIQTQLSTGPFILKTFAFWVVIIGVLYDNALFVRIGAVGLVVAWYWLDFNIWRWLQGKVERVK